MRVGLTLTGSEHGEDEMLRGAELAQRQDPSIEVIVFGSAAETKLTLYRSKRSKRCTPENGRYVRKWPTSGMGCTGPVIMVASEDAQAAVNVLKEAEYL